MQFLRFEWRISKFSWQCLSAALAIFHLSSCSACCLSEKLSEILKTEERFVYLSGNPPNIMAELSMTFL